MYNKATEKGKGQKMKEYTVVYIKNCEECGCDYYIAGATISEIVDELIDKLNRHDIDCEYITIFDVNDEEDIHYIEVLNICGYYVLSEKNLLMF